MNCTLPHLVQSVFGLRITYERNANGTELRLRPKLYSRGTGFSIVSKLHYRGVARAEAVYETYAGELVHALLMGSEGLSEAFRFVELLSEGLSVEIAVHDKRAKTLAEAQHLLTGVDRPDSVKLKFLHRVADGETADVELVSFAALGFMLIASRTVSAAVDDGDIDALPQEMEGAEVVSESVRYERSRINRARCIAFHGARCAACGFEFGKTYGPFADGFIEVHHIVPVSTYGEERRVCPETDLIPLCPNCHRAVHLSNPPLDFAVLKSEIEQRRSL